MDATLPRAGAVGSIFAVPEADWVSINDRAAIVIAEQGISSGITRYIRNFADLVTACELWSSRTFPELITQSCFASLFSDRTVSTLTDLAGLLAPLWPDDRLPDSVRLIVTVEFAALHDAAATQGTRLNGLAAQINNFVRQNRMADEAIATAYPEIGSAWATIAGPLDSLEGAIADVIASWSAVTEAFSTASNPPPDVTVACLGAADIGAAIRSWNEVDVEAASFDCIASNLTATQGPVTQERGEVRCLSTPVALSSTVPSRQLAATESGASSRHSLFRWFELGDCASV